MVLALSSCARAAAILLHVSVHQTWLLAPPVTPLQGIRDAKKGPLPHPPNIPPTNMEEHSLAFRGITSSSLEAKAVGRKIGLKKQPLFCSPNPSHISLEEINPKKTELATYFPWGPSSVALGLYVPFRTFHQAVECKGWPGLLQRPIW